MNWILKDKEPVQVSSEEWGEWFEKADRHVGTDTVGDVSISTVFLGVDHQFGDGPPLLFETMIFGGEHDGYRERCSTYEQAEAMHQKAMELVK